MATSWIPFKYLQIPGKNKCKFTHAAVTQKSSSYHTVDFFFKLLLTDYFARGILPIKRISERSFLVSYTKGWRFEKSLLNRCIINLSMNSLNSGKLKFDCFEFYQERIIITELASILIRKVILKIKQSLKIPTDPVFSNAHQSAKKLCQLRPRRRCREKMTCAGCASASSPATEVFMMA